MEGPSSVVSIRVGPNCFAESFPSKMIDNKKELEFGNEPRFGGRAAIEFFIYRNIINVIYDFRWVVVGFQAMNSTVHIEF